MVARELFQPGSEERVDEVVSTIIVRTVSLAQKLHADRAVVVATNAIKIVDAAVPLR